MCLWQQISFKICLQSKIVWFAKIVFIGIVQIQGFLCQNSPKQRFIFSSLTFEQ